MTLTESTQYTFRPITAAHAATLRAEGGDVYVADAKPGYPCRQCLRDADIGEELILLSFDPFTKETPYRSASPIFIHREDCSDRLDRSPLPRQLADRQLSVRAFDTVELMTNATVIDGGSLPETLEEFFSDETVRSVHVHNATRGCFATVVERVEPRPRS